MHLAPVLLHGELKLDRAHRGAGTAFEAVARATTTTTMICWTGVLGCLKERGGAIGSLVRVGTWVVAVEDVRALSACNDRGAF